MADNAEMLFAPELVFLIGSARHRARCLRSSRASSPRAATLPMAGLTPFAHARTPIHGPCHAGGQYRHPTY